MTTLYKKVGRRYKPVVEHEHTRPHRADQAVARPLHSPGRAASAARVLRVADAED